MFKLYFYLYRIEVVYIGRSRMSETRRHTTFSNLSWEGRGGGHGYDLVTHLSNVINASDKSENGYLRSFGATLGG